MQPSAEKAATLSVFPVSPIGPRDLPRRIQITDGTLSLVAKGFGTLERIALPPGVYQARVESAQKPFEQMVFLAPGQEVSVSYPVNSGETLASAAPVPGSDAMHETMREPLDKAVMRPATNPTSGRVLLMANHSTQGGAAIDFAAFRLFDSEGKPVGNPSKESSTGEGNAFKLFSQDVAPGGLVLEGLAGNFATDIRIQQPVWCSAGWCTLIFIGVNSKTGVPDLNTVSIYLWRIGHSFAPETPVDAIPNDPATNFVMESQRYTELALHSLVNGRSLLSMEEVDTNLLIQKFSNPMLGILGCHLLLRQTPIDETMIATVLRNLDGLVPGHPDVVALRVLARQAGLKNLTGETPPVAWPPMLRQGFLALRDEYWQQPKAVQPGSLYDRVRTRVLSGGVWTRWIAGEETVPVNRPGKSRIPSILRRPRSIPAFASGIASRSRNAFSYARELVRGGTKVHPDDLKWSGLSRQEASTMLRLVSETIRRGPRTVMKIAARKKKAVKAKKSPRARGTNGFVKKAVVAKKFAAKKVSARRSKGRPRASR